MTELGVPETAYDLAFLEAAYQGACALASEYDDYVYPSMPDEALGWWYRFWYPWHFFHVVDTLPMDHPWKERLEHEWIDERKAAELSVPPDDPELWQIIRDTVADLPLPRFSDWFPDLFRHRLAESSARELGIERWYSLALEDPGLPLYSSFVSYDPFGSNRRRRCIERYTYPVPLNITVEECRACFVWALTMAAHMERALQEVGAIYRSVEDLAEELEFEPAALEANPECYLSLLRRLDEPRTAHAESLGNVSRARDRDESGNSVSAIGAPEESLTAFRVFWSYWMRWFPAELLARRGVDSPVILRLLDAFPPNADDREAWELLGEVFGDLPLARFCFWFGEAVGYGFARQRARDLGILPYLELVCRNPGRPPETATAVPPLLRRGWVRESPTQSRLAPHESRVLFEWLAAMRDRIEAVVRFVQS